VIRIAHRGNVAGINHMENHPDYIQKALDEGYDAEIDVRYVSNGFFLGHDEPQFEVDLKFLQKKGLWIHCKDRDTYNHLSQFKDLNIFYHTESAWEKGYPTRTSHDYIWEYPTIYDSNGDVYGICSDNCIE
jgi:hypothetical protein